MADGYDEDEERWPLKEGQRVETLEGDTGTVFWCYREEDFWRVHYVLDDGRNESSLHFELKPSNTPPPEGDFQSDLEDCARCGDRPAEYDTPTLLCERCWKEWLYSDWSN